MAPSTASGAVAQKKDVPIPNTALLKELKMIRLMAMNKFAFIKPVVVLLLLEHGGHHRTGGGPDAIVDGAMFDRNEPCGSSAAA